ncbi:MAG TPA: hypothetical protein DD420_00920 [Streptomyces sp.]|nr:hypothetical protein [Streptomyces sp.]
MSAQPDHVPVTPHGPAPGASAELLTQLRADPRASTWAPAFEREWAAALEESRRTFSLAYDDREFISMAELRGRRR